jgi:hypothetical protein
LCVAAVAAAVVGLTRQASPAFAQDSGYFLNTVQTNVTAEVTGDYHDRARVDASDVKESVRPVTLGGTPARPHR